jgi:hypothetical protein
MSSDDYARLFFQTINKQPGQPADDYEKVLGESGIPAGYGPNIKPDASMPFNAMTQQIGSDGRIAGRIFLPTATPDENGYYTHPFSPLRDGPASGSLVWEWRDLGGPPVVTPEGGVSREEVKAMIDAALGDVVKIKDKIALRTNSGLLAGLNGGGPTTENAPIEWIGKGGEPHSWESLTIERGE